MTSCTCSWCHHCAPAGPCPACGHRNDMARLDCTCTPCTGRRQRAEGDGYDLTDGLLAFLAETPLESP